MKIRFWGKLPKEENPFPGKLSKEKNPLKGK